MTAEYELAIVGMKCSGLQPSSAMRRIDMVANFGVVNSMKTSAPEALSLASCGSMVVSETLYVASATIGILPARPSFRPFMYSLPIPSS